MKASEVQNAEGAIIGHAIICPACDAADMGSYHVFYTKKKDGKPGWTFNGDINRPTFSPSMNSTATPSDPEDGKPYRCHSFVRDGRIEYLGDCTHAMAGQSVELPDMEA